jgi:hypothetical protein
MLESDHPVRPGDYVEVVAILPGGKITDQALVTVTP